LVYQGRLVSKILLCVFYASPLRGYYAPALLLWFNINVLRFDHRRSRAKPGEAGRSRAEPDEVVDHKTQRSGVA